MGSKTCHGINFCEIFYIHTSAPVKKTPDSQFTNMYDEKYPSNPHI